MNTKDCPHTLWDLIDPSWREREAALASKFLAAIPARDPLVKIGRRTVLCGECHLQKGETCDVCGAKTDK